MLAQVVRRLGSAMVGIGAGSILIAASDQDPLHLQRSCDDGNAGDCYTLSQLYEKGQVVPKDKDRARALLKKACAADVERCPDREIGKLALRNVGLDAGPGTDRDRYSCMGQPVIDIVIDGKSHGVGTEILKLAPGTHEVRVQPRRINETCEIRDWGDCTRAGGIISCYHYVDERGQKTFKVTGAFPVHLEPVETAILTLSVEPASEYTFEYRKLKTITDSGGKPILARQIEIQNRDDRKAAAKGRIAYVDCLRPDTRSDSRCQ